MDTMYSNKKYLQSLTAGSDFYRSSSSVRPVVSHKFFIISKPDRDYSHSQAYMYLGIDKTIKA